MVNNLDTIILLKSEININIVNIYINKLYNFTNSFVEIYVILRILKQPVDGNISSLSLCFFGNQHILLILEILKIIDKYELCYRMDKTKDVSRCKTFDFALNLTEEVRLHNIRKNI